MACVGHWEGCQLGTILGKFPKIPDRGEKAQKWSWLVIGQSFKYQCDWLTWPSVAWHPNETDYSRTYLERPPHWPQKCGLSRQVVSGDRFSYIEVSPSAKIMWSVKTVGLSWQWSLKTGFTVFMLRFCGTKYSLLAIAKPLLSESV